MQVDPEKDQNSLNMHLHATGLSRVAEVVPTDNVLARTETEFTDSRGERRGPQELAAEVELTDEITDVVDRHFTKFYANLSSIDENIDELERILRSSPEVEKELFDPFDEQFMRRVKLTVASQIDEITEERQVQPTQADRRFKLPKRFSPLSKHVTRTEMVIKDGYTKKGLAGYEERQIAELRYAYYGDIHKSDDTQLKREERKQRVTRILTEVAENLLCSDIGEPDRTFREGQSRRCLPLLATRVFEAGIDPESLDMEKIYELVPEIQPVKAAAANYREQVKDFLTKGLTGKIYTNIFELLPDKDLISALYYSESDLNAIVSRQDKMNNLIQQAGHFYNSWRADELLERARGTIGDFFKNKVFADTLVFHGTPALPRIIKSGFIYPAEKMRQMGHPFTYNTRRTGVPGRKELKAGSYGIHWSGQHGEAYARDSDTTLDERIEQDPLLRQKELQKGLLAGGAVAVRIGDALQHASYIGWGHMGDSETRDVRLHNVRSIPSVRSAVVTLTEAGHKKVEADIKDQYPNDDIVFLAAPRDAEDEEVFDYGFPLAEMLFEIGESQQGVTLAALREAGWTDEMIKQKTIIFRDHDFRSGAADQLLLKKALEHPKYRRGVVIGLEREKVSGPV